MLFALHALLLTSLTLAQIGFYERGGQRVSPLVCYAVGLAMLVVTVYAGASSENALSVSEAVRGPC